MHNNIIMVSVLQINSVGKFACVPRIVSICLCIDRIDVL